MKIKLMVSHKKYNELSDELTSLGIEINNNSKLVLTEENQYIDFIMGKQQDSFSPVSTSEIVFIETFGNDVVLHTEKENYNISERLIRLESILDPAMFLRISNSVIVAVKKIRKIHPAFSSKYTLTLTDGSQVDVTRSYYNRFRDYFGL